MEVVFLTPGPTRRSFYREGIAFYLHRMRGLWPHVTYRELPAVRGKSPSRAREEESAQLAGHLQQGDVTVLLDERGRLWSTRAFARQWEQWLHRSVRRLVFVAGGAYGVTDALKTRADMVWALSPLTFPHELARLIWAEQFYRVLTLWKGLPYHH